MMAWRSALKNHPFDVDARFDFSLVLTYALPAETLAAMVPAALALDTFVDAAGDEHAFVAIAMVQTRGLRPSRLPALFGRDFFLVGTRIFARLPTAEGRRLRGLYIVRSQTNRRAMRVLGDLFTRYRYEFLDTHVSRDHDVVRVHADDFAVDVDASTADVDSVPLPSTSPFTSWRDARRFAGPMPYTFSALSDDEVLVVEGVREAWQPRPVRVLRADVPFFAQRHLPTPRLASAFIVENVPYHWAAGRKVAVVPPTTATTTTTP